MWELGENNQPIKASAVIPVNAKKKAIPENLFPLFKLWDIDPTFKSLSIR